MFPLNLQKIEIGKLVPHEQFREDHALEVLNWFERDGFQLRPIAVHRLKNENANHEERFLILDGHHRTEAARRLGLKCIMTNVVDYLDPRIVVESWGDGPRISKESIIQTALNGEKVAPKSTKHIIKTGEEEAPFQDNDFVEPKIYAILEALRM